MQPIKLTKKKISFEEVKLFRIEKKEFLNNDEDKIVECIAKRIDLTKSARIVTKIIGFIYLSLTENEIKEYEEHDPKKFTHMIMTAPLEFLAIINEINDSTHSIIIL
jgi:hypothetical protein